MSVRALTLSRSNSKSSDFYPLTEGFISIVLNLKHNMSALTEAYREYLDRMFEKSHDLYNVDVFTVPQDVDVTSPTAQEWAHFE